MISDGYRVPSKDRSTPPPRDLRFHWRPFVSSVGPCVPPQVWGFETFTSERRQSRPEDSEAEPGRASGGDAKDASSLYRKRARVFPEVGCALDNLSV